MLPSADPHPSLRDTFSSREKAGWCGFCIPVCNFFLVLRRNYIYNVKLTKCCY